MRGKDGVDMRVRKKRRTFISSPPEDNVGQHSLRSETVFFSLQSFIIFPYGLGPSTPC